MYCSDKVHTVFACHLLICFHILNCFGVNSCNLAFNVDIVKLESSKNSIMLDLIDITHQAGMQYM